MLGAVSVAAYSYMSLVPLIQPPIMRALTTEKERHDRHGRGQTEPISQTTKIVFPIVVTIFASILAPKGAPLDRHGHARQSDDAKAAWSTA